MNLEKLPFELQLEILSYLDSYDIIQFSNVSTYWHKIALDRKLIKHIRFYNDYRLGHQLQTFMSTVFKPEWVTTLNLNCCHWIPHLTLYKSIEELHMLKCLYVIDTSFRFCPDDLVLLRRLLRLRRLGITSGPEKVDRNLVRLLSPNITGLCLHLLRPPQRGALERLTYLEELWVICPQEDYAGRFQSTMNILLRQLKRVVICWDIELMENHTVSTNKICTFSSNQITPQLCYEGTDKPFNNMYGSSWYPIESNWEELISELYLIRPFGMADARKLVLNKCPLDKIMLEELNFRHYCEVLRNNINSEILVSHITRFLKKLSISYCICEDGKSKTGENEQTLASCTNRSMLEKIADNSPLIEELEIWECSVGAQVNDKYSGFKFIKCFTNLKKLTLSGIPNHVDCEFIVDVCKECKNLTSLRISSFAKNSNLCDYVCLALPYATGLVDFRFERHVVPYTKILESLNQIKDSRLKRLVFRSDGLDLFPYQMLLAFYTTHPLIHLLYVCFISASESLALNANAHLNASSQLIYAAKEIRRMCCITNEIGARYCNLAVPSIHLYEMVDLNSMISVVDIFNGFR